MRRKFSRTWIKSKQPRKQRKYRYNATLNIKSKFLGSHLSKEFRKKYKKRSMAVRKGDGVKVLRGQFKGKTGKIDKVDIKKSKVYITGIEVTKKDGTKALHPIHPSNLIITDLNLEDKKRVKILERR
jgi:large subunit ribosomal protein L24